MQEEDTNYSTKRHALEEGDGQGFRQENRAEL